MSNSWLLKKICSVDSLLRSSSFVANNSNKGTSSSSFGDELVLGIGSNFSPGMGSVRFRVLSLPGSRKIGREDVHAESNAHEKANQDSLSLSSGNSDDSTCDSIDLEAQDNVLVQLELPQLLKSDDLHKEDFICCLNAGKMKEISLLESQSGSDEESSVLYGFSVILCTQYRCLLFGFQVELCISPISSTNWGLTARNFNLVHEHCLLVVNNILHNPQPTSSITPNSSSLLSLEKSSDFKTLVQAQLHPLAPHSHVGVLDSFGILKIFDFSRLISHRAPSSKAGSSRISTGNMQSRQVDHLWNSKVLPESCWDFDAESESNQEINESNFGDQLNGSSYKRSGAYGLKSLEQTEPPLRFTDFCFGGLGCRAVGDDYWESRSSETTNFKFQSLWPSICAYAVTSTGSLRKLSPVCPAEFSCRMSEFLWAYLDISEALDRLNKAYWQLERNLDANQSQERQTKTLIRALDERINRLQLELQFLDGLTSLESSFGGGIYEDDSQDWSAGSLGAASSFSQATFSTILENVKDQLRAVSSKLDYHEKLDALPPSIYLRKVGFRVEASAGTARLGNARLSIQRQTFPYSHRITTTPAMAWLDNPIGGSVLTSAREKFIDLNKRDGDDWNIVDILDEQIDNDKCRIMAGTHVLSIPSSSSGKSSPLPFSIDWIAIGYRIGGGLIDVGIFQSDLSIILSIVDEFLLGSLEVIETYSQKNIFDVSDEIWWLESLGFGSSLINDPAQFWSPIEHNRLKMLPLFSGILNYADSAGFLVQLEDNSTCYKGLEENASGVWIVTLEGLFAWFIGKMTLGEGMERQADGQLVNVRQLIQAPACSLIDDNNDNKLDKSSSVSSLKMTDFCIVGGSFIRKNDSLNNGSFKEQTGSQQAELYAILSDGCLAHSGLVAPVESSSVELMSFDGGIAGVDTGLLDESAKQISQQFLPQIFLNLPGELSIIEGYDTLLDFFKQKQVSANLQDLIGQTSGIQISDDTSQTENLSSSIQLGSSTRSNTQYAAPPVVFPRQSKTLRSLLSKDPLEDCLNFVERELVVTKDEKIRIDIKINDHQQSKDHPTLQIDAEKDRYPFVMNENSFQTKSLAITQILEKIISVEEYLPAYEGRLELIKSEYDRLETLLQSLLVDSSVSDSEKSESVKPKSLKFITEKISKLPGRLQALSDKQEKLNELAKKLLVKAMRAYHPNLSKAEKRWQQDLEKKYANFPKLLDRVKEVSERFELLKSSASSASLLDRMSSLSLQRTPTHGSKSFQQLLHRAQESEKFIAALLAEVRHLYYLSRLVNE